MAWRHLGVEECSDRVPSAPITYSSHPCITHGAAPRALHAVPPGTNSGTTTSLARLFGRRRQERRAEHTNDILDIIHEKILVERAVFLEVVRQLQDLLALFQQRTRLCMCA